MKNFGYFLNGSIGLHGLRYGNWGSRPYEYFWASTIIDCKDKVVLDIGTGLPSEHNWYEFVSSQLNPKEYIGIDIDSRLKNEEINTDKCKMLHMNCDNLLFEDNKFDVVFSISTFEHFDNLSNFYNSMKELQRVCKKDALMVVTLDELWDLSLKDTQNSSWNELEKLLIKENLFKQETSAFGMVDFIKLIDEWFEPVNCDIKDVEKINANENLIHTKIYNSSVSYGVFKVKK